LLFFDEAGAFFSHEISPRPSKFEALNFSKAHGLSRSVFRKSRNAAAAEHKWRCGSFVLLPLFRRGFEREQIGSSRKRALEGLVFCRQYLLEIYLEPRINQTHEAG
jgi:hypothetical protein